MVYAVETLASILSLLSSFKIAEPAASESIGEEVLYENWGGTRKSETPFGHVRTGGKIPLELRYNPSKDLPPDKLQKLTVSARSAGFVPVVLDEHRCGRRIKWWWRLDSNDISFGIYRSAPGQEKVAEHNDDFMVHPKFKLQTEFVPEDGEVSQPGKQPVPHML
ncbi:unnamed protein product [Heligmosomoides polygyrus]|uniref:Secreted protein n=1 Tax=Heligmosomoides polygyrus TaxID=6339 RepID=A0A183GU50_HELPZ|nr:unnamed protein product [Heligmosomoides polygyrus]